MNAKDSAYRCAHRRLLDDPANLTIGDVLGDVARDLETCDTAEDVDAAFASVLDRVADFLSTTSNSPSTPCTRSPLTSDTTIRSVSGTRPRSPFRPSSIDLCRRIDAWSVRNGVRVSVSVDR
jgi:hypothetical protein